MNTWDFQGGWGVPVPEHADAIVKACNDALGIATKFNSIGKTVVLRNGHSGKLLTLKAGHWNGSEAFLDNPNGGSIQGWVISDAGHGTFTIRASESSGMLLGTKHFSHKPQNDQDPVILHVNNGDSSQRWKIEALDGGFWRIVNANSAKAISTLHQAAVPASSQVNERIIQFRYYGDPTQKWRIELR